MKKRLWLLLLAPITAGIAGGGMTEPAWLLVALIAALTGAVILLMHAFARQSPQQRRDVIKLVRALRRAGE